MTIRRILPIVAIAVFGGVPAALAVTADPFGPIEIADPVYRPGPLFNDAATVAGADANGNVSLATLYRTSGAPDQLQVLDRCNAWQGTVVSASPKDILPVGLEVGRDGTAMAVWEQDDLHYSAVRPPGGAWGTPQLIAGAEHVSLKFAVGDGGEAIAAWADGNAPAGTRAAVRPAGGTWGAPEDVAATTNLFDVAIGPAGAAVVAYRGGTPGPVLSRYRSAGGTWTAAAEVVRNNYSNTLHTMRVEFTGDGRTVVVADFRELDDTIRWNVGTAGVWGPTDRVLDDDGDPPANVQYGWRLVQQLERHPDGLVATWVRWPTQTNFKQEVVVGRFNGTGWDLKVFAPADGPLFDSQLAVNSGGEILVTADHYVGTGGPIDIRSVIAPSLTAPWPDLALASPAAVSTKQFRESFAVSGGTAFAVGWGVHGGGNQRTEVISTKPCSGAPTPTATATASASPSPSPDPLPQPGPSPAPTPPAPAPQAPVASAFVKLPAANKCVRRGGKLKVQFTRPPAGYAVRSVGVKLASKTVATLKGKALRKPYYLRKLPKKPFTLTVSVKLTNGKSLTEKRRYVVCK